MENKIIFLEGCSLEEQEKIQQMLRDSDVISENPEIEQYDGSNELDNTDRVSNILSDDVVF